MGLRKSILVTAAVVATTGVTLVASERLLHPTTKNGLFWSSPSNISIVINAAGADDILDGGHVTAIGNAIAAWNAVAGTNLHLAEDASPASMARTDYTSSGIHLVMFDESNSSGFFGGNGTVAVTPVWFFSNGVISDADVLYNGGDFQFTTSGQGGRFDVQDPVAHELGHLIGFDHSGWAGATMYPYVDPTVILHRSLSLDDITGVRSVYPAASYGSITGAVVRASDSSPVVGAHVVARDTTGRTRAATLTRPGGTFTLGGLDADTYTIHVTPLEGAVSSANLGSGYTNGTAGYVIETDFRATDDPGGPVVVTAGAATALAADIAVGADTSFRLGSNADNYPLRMRTGQTATLVVSGANLSTGVTLTPSDPSIAIGSVVWGFSSVQFQCTVPGGAATGHFDLTATEVGGAKSILVAPIEITPPDPTVTLVSPNQGTDAGGTTITITGTGFAAGARVVIGDAIYVDGELGGCTGVDPNTITLTTAPTIGGEHDVVVIDRTGVEWRRPDGSQSPSVPTRRSVFPAAGNVFGGTDIVLRGTNFTFDAQVRIDGVTQTGVTVLDSTRIEISTLAGAAGARPIEVVNPGGAIATLQYTYVVQPDPDLTTVTPDTGASSGGETILVQGSNFDADTTVVFGASADTGLGGTPATSVTLLDANTLEVVTPSVSSGARNVMVSNSMTGQADVLAAGFTFTGGGGGGGGCSLARVPGTGPFDPASVAAGGAWALVCLLYAVARARRRPRTSTAPVRV